MGNRYDMEILAPAGSFDIFKAVIDAGADAVYLGGDMFGARAYAGNFGREELIAALDYAHVRDKRVYMTVNTLLKERELSDMLVDYIAPFYEAGLDAAIVQDFGVFRKLKKNFPDLALHASTQMTVTGAYSAKLLETMGAARVVTARELNLSEIKQIHDTCNVEIESFVHGALCYCYSGQCLLSSMNGFRSGNRGRCAQPCRLAHDVSGDAQRSNTYALSPKDMCALNILPDIAKAGVYSLKIEGRMKNVTYAAGVTAIYRKYLDMLNERGREGYKVSDDDISDLMDMYNRGAFTTGYYNNTKGRSMMSVDRPNHKGVDALVVMDNVNGRVTFKALTDINRQDVFEIDGDNSFSSGTDVTTGGKLIVNLPKKYRLNKGRVLIRTRNNRIVSEVADRYTHGTYRLPVDMWLYACEGSNLSLYAQVDMPALKETVSVSVTGGQISKAVSHKAIESEVRKQLAQLGNTDFVANSINVEITGDVFIPAGEIKSIRRNAIDSLKEEVLKHFRRTACTDTHKALDVHGAGVLQGEIKKTAVYTEEKCLHNVLVFDDKQFAAAVRSDDIKDIYVDFSTFAAIKDDIRALLNPSALSSERNADIKGSGRNIIPALPHVLRGKHTDKQRCFILEAKAVGVDTFLVRSLEELGLIGEAYPGARIVLDANMYCWNSEAVLSYMDVAKQLKLTVKRITYPYELNKEEISRMADICEGIETELIVKSRIPLMVSEQCVKKTYGVCDGSGGTMLLRDKKGRNSIVKSVCDYCYSIVYSDMYDIHEYVGELISLGCVPDCLRYEESTDCQGGIDGHFNVGVE